MISWINKKKTHEFSCEKSLEKRGRYILKHKYVIFKSCRQMQVHSSSPVSSQRPMPTYVAMCYARFFEKYVKFGNGGVKG